MVPMEEAEYSRLPGIAAHRRWSLVIVLLWQVTDLYFFWPLMLRQRALLILPLICIWFADEMADRNAMRPELSKFESNARVIRCTGWVVLILGMSFFTAVGCYVFFRNASSGPPQHSGAFPN